MMVGSFWQLSTLGGACAAAAAALARLALQEHTLCITHACMLVYSMHATSMSTHLRNMLQISSRPRVTPMSTT